jgi:PAS domain S-box-containing protein
MKLPRADTAALERVESRLAESEARYRRLAENAQDIVYRIRFLPAPALEYINPAVAAVTGYPPAELMADPLGFLQQRAHPDDQAVVRAALEGRQADGPIAFRMLRRDGTVVWLELRGTPVLDSTGRLEAVEGIARDITESKRIEAKLRLQAEVVRNMAGGVCMVKAGDETILYASPVFERMFGYAPGELNGEAISMLNAPSAGDPEATAQTIMGKLAQSGAWKGKLRSIRKDGAEFWTSASVSAFEHPEHGRVFVAVQEDVDDIQRAADALRDSEEKFRQIFEQTNEGIALVDETGAVIEWNRANERITGISRETAVSMPVWELQARYAAPDARGRDISESQKAMVLDALRTGQSPYFRRPFENAIVRSDGQRRLLQQLIFPVRTDKGCRIGVVMRDITDAKRSEMALRASEARERERADELQALMDAVPANVWIARDPDCRVITGNRSAAEFLRMAVDANHAKSVPERADTRHYRIFRHGREVPAEEMPVSRAARGAQVRDYAHDVVFDDGTIRHVTGNASPLRDAEGRLRGAVAAFIDVTAIRHMEDSLWRASKLEALGTLAAGVAHDFNNLLLAITGNARLASADLPADHAAQESLSEIAKAASRATSLVRQILAFGRSPEMEPAVIAVQPSVDEALGLLRVSLPAAIQIEKRYAAHPVRVLCHATEIHQMVTNLVNNAAQAIAARRPGEPAGRIVVGVEAVEIDADLERRLPDVPPGRYARLTVSDDGCGMDLAMQRRIFDPFFTTKPFGRGAGLGLSVVYGIVKSRAGAIDVSSQPGHGATFVIHLPSADAARGSSASAPAVPAAVPAAVPTAVPAAVPAAVPTAAAPYQPTDPVLPAAAGRVMVVDDEEPLVFLLSRVLRRMGYAVDGYTSPRQALDAFIAEPRAYNAVVTDLSMPGMTGIDLARALRAARQDVLIVMTTGYVRPDDQAAVAQAGIQELILKPNTVDELGQVLDRMFSDPTRRFRSSPPPAAGATATTAANTS